MNGTIFPGESWNGSCSSCKSKSIKLRNKKITQKVKKLQRLLLTSKGANLIAVRRVSQINRGKHTPGIDGKTALTNRERKVLADMMDLKAEAKPIRRVWIPKPGKEKKSDR